MTTIKRLAPLNVTLAAVLLAAHAGATPVSRVRTTTPALAQQQEAKPKIAPELLEALQGTNDPRQEMIELFHKVETRLDEIDKLLYQAGAGERSAKGLAAESGLAQLLESSRAKSSEVISGIDRILEIAKQQGGT